MMAKPKLDEVYRVLGKFSEPYAVDFKRFLFSLRILEQRNLIIEKRILDLGGGVGVMMLALKALGAKEVIGIDKFIFPLAPNSPYKVADFAKLQDIWKEHDISVVEGDMLERLPFADGYFDLVNCDAAIEHLLHSPKRLFAEMRRIVKPNGVVLITTPNLANLLRRVRFLVGRSPSWDIKDYFEQSELFAGHRREFTVHELCQMLVWSGFQIQYWNTSNSFFYPKQLLVPRKFIRQVCNIISWPFPRTREMILVLAKKAEISST